MPYDPSLPAPNSLLQSQVIRDQLQALFNLINNIVTVTSAQVNAVNTLPPGSAAAVSVQVLGNTLRFTFDIPQGAAGEPGGVTQSELDSAILGTAINPSSLSPIGTFFMDPISASDLNQVAGKLDELISALKRNA